ncbi:MAG TPA: transporter [Clostridia bacterium]|nr:transporter [Clostridia bacterium]
MKPLSKRSRLLTLSLIAACFHARAAEHSPGIGRNVEGIMDNSFLVEEAYNQERGVVQHIATLQYGWEQRAGRDDEFWNLAFTQEWPFPSQTHQLSYTIPYAWSRTGGAFENGFGDVLLSYRFQAYYDPERLMAFAPRASLILPTGDADAGLGEDTLGLQFNLPFSTALSDDWFLHFNAGMTWLPDAASAENGDLVHFNLGASVIYAATHDCHVIVEWVGFSNEFRELNLGRERDFVSLLSPGVRKAFNFASGSQLVAGVALPIGLSSESPDVGCFFYLSFEHAFARTESE